MGRGAREPGQGHQLNPGLFALLEHQFVAEGVVQFRVGVVDLEGEGLAVLA